MQRLEKIKPTTEDKTNSLAYLIHNYYSCVEDILKEIEKVFEEGGRFSKDNYHKTLLLHATYEIQQVRPIIISASNYIFLLEILKFRHVFRHAYNYVLDPVRVKNNKSLIIKNHAILIDDFNNFIAFLKSIYDN
ncbi:MAG: hypothetical protein ACKVOU_14495 [Cytophagales bacterium]